MKFNRKKRNKAQKANEKAYIAVPEVAQNVEGQTLAQRLASGGALAEADVLPILSQLLLKLQALHAGGELHLGLCEQSVIIDEAGHVHLGESQAKNWKLMAAGEAEYPLSFFGYQAPEQLGFRIDSVGPWTDLFALGATLYRLLTFTKVPELTMIIGEGEDAFEFPEGVSERMRALILHLMKPNRRQRPQSVGELKDWILPEAEPAAEEAPAAEPAAEEAPAEAPAAEEAPAEEPAAEEAPAAESAAEEALAEEPAAEKVPAEEPEEETDDEDEDEHHWYNLDREDFLTLLFVVGFTAVLLLCKAFI